MMAEVSPILYSCSSISKTVSADVAVCNIVYLNMYLNPITPTVSSGGTYE